jgi:signal transduction histidine kinase
MKSGPPVPPPASRPIVSGAGVFDVPRELRLLPLLAGIGVLFALGLIALVGAVSLAGRQADELVTAESSVQVARVIEDQTRTLATLTMDWAWWNEGIERLALVPDRVYADANLGDYTTVNFGLFGSMVISPQDRPIFGYLRGRPLPQGELAHWVDVLRPLIDATRRDSAARPVPATAFAVLNGHTVMASVVAMMAEEGTPPVDWPQPGVLVFMRELDRPFLDSMAQSAGINGLRIGDFGIGTRHALMGPDGAPVGMLSWRVHLPSQSILMKLWPLGTLIALVMLGFGGLVAVSLVRHAQRYHLHRVQQEQRLLTAMLEAREASHAKSLFLANMSHELRTPLNAVIGYAQLLRLCYVGTMNDKQHEYVDSIEGAGRHLLALLQDILDLSKIEAGREELEEADVSIGEVVGKAIALTAPRVREGGAAIAVQGAQPISLKVDGRRLMQMVLNLVSNALRFTPQGGTITIGWQRRSDGSVAITVGDQGPGIPRADMARVLEPFHRRVDNTAHHASDSNGLGLPLTARIMALHGGRIELENSPAGGLMASLVFPASRDRGTPTGPDPASDPALAATLRSGAA